MAINIHHSSGPNIALLAQAAYQVGGRRKADELEEQLYRRELQERQLDDSRLRTLANHDLAERGQNLQQARHYDTLSAQVYNQDQNRASEWQQQQLNAGVDLAQMQADSAQQQDQWVRQSAPAVDQQLKEAFKAVNAMNLNPQGTKLRGELQGQWAKVQGMRGQMPAATYLDFASQVLGKLNESGLDAMEIKEPSEEEEFLQNASPLSGQQIVPGQPLPMGWYRVRSKRAGATTFENHFIPPRTPEEQQSYMEQHRLPPNSQYYIPDGKGGGKLIDTSVKPGESPETARAEAAFKSAETQAAADKANFDRTLAVKKDLREEWKATKTRMVSGPTAGSRVMEIDEPYDKFLARRLPEAIKEYNLAVGDPETETVVPMSQRMPSTMDSGLPEGGGLDGVMMQDELGADPMQDEQADGGEIIGPNKAGRYARKSADGSIELLPEGFAP